MFDCMCSSSGTVITYRGRSAEPRAADKERAGNEVIAQQLQLASTWRSQMKGQNDRRRTVGREPRKWVQSGRKKAGLGIVQG